MMQNAKGDSYRTDRPPGIQIKQKDIVLLEKVYDYQEKLEELEARLERARFRQVNASGKGLEAGEVKRQIAKICEEIEDEIQAIKAEQQSRDAALSEDLRQEASRNAMYSDKVTFSGALPCAVQWLLCSTCGLLLQPSAMTCLY